MSSERTPLGLVAEINTFIREKQITWRQLVILLQLRSEGTPIPENRLDEFNNISKGTCSAALASMAGKGLVKTWLDYSPVATEGRFGRHQQRQAREFAELLPKGREIAEEAEQIITGKDHAT